MQAPAFDAAGEAVHPRWRRLRAGLFAGVTAGLSIAGHLLADGALPDLALLTLLTGLLGVVASGLARRRRRFHELLVALVLAQLLFHTTLELGTHRHPAAGGAMWLFHGVAAVLAATLLAHGEAVLFRLLGWLSRVAPTRLDSLPVPVLLWVPVHRSRALVGRVTTSPLRRRGPPLGFAPS